MLLCATSSVCLILHSYQTHFQVLQVEMVVLAVQYETSHSSVWKELSIF